METGQFDATRWLQELTALETDLHSLVSLLSEAQFHAPSKLGGWSVGYCIEHLVLTGRAYLPAWDRSLEEAAGRPMAPFWRFSWWRRGVLLLAEPPVRWKAQAPQSTLPCSRHSMDVTLRRFSQMHQDFAARINKCEGVELARVRVVSPFRSWVSYPLGFSFDLALAHERRHLWQAWQIRKQFDLERKDDYDQSKRDDSRLPAPG